jgi:SAM-dependent methyltransferase
MRSGLGRDDRAGGALSWLAERLPELTAGRVLDLGCGDGRFLPPRAVGLDIAEDRLVAARLRSSLLVRADARAIPFGDATFDTVYAHRMLNDTADLDGVLREIVRVLAPGGRLLVFTRARSASGDRLDRANGMERLRRHFLAVSVEVPPRDERAALFIAERPLRSDPR